MGPSSLVRDGQPSPHRPLLVVSRTTCPPLSPSPHANSLIKGNAVINTHIPCWGWVLSSRWTYYLTQLVKLSPSTSKRSRYKHRKCKFTSVYYITWLTEKRFGSRNSEFGNSRVMSIWKLRERAVVLGIIPELRGE